MEKPVNIKIDELIIKICECKLAVLERLEGQIKDADLVKLKEIAWTITELDK